MNVHELPAVLTTAELAEALGLSKRTIESWRLEGRGPRGRRLGRRVRYAREDVIAWYEAQPEIGGGA